MDGQKLLMLLIKTAPLTDLMAELQGASYYFRSEPAPTIIVYRPVLEF